MRINNKDLENKISNAPILPGCYIYRDKSNNVLYVGKAKILRNRVKSYFADFDAQGLRIQKMVKLIHDVEFVIADTDEEAFILETNLIRKYKPKYNVEKKDDKNYSWVMLDNDEDFPRIQIVRKRTSKNAIYFGPYAKQVPIKRTLISVRKIFPYRTCNRVIKSKDGVITSSNKKPCLYYHLGLCNAPCAGNLSTKDYRSNIRKIKYFFEGKKQELIEKLKSEMFNLSASKDFEKAAQIRDQIADLVYLTQKVDVEESTDEVKFRQIKRQNQSMALNDLIEIVDDPRLELHQDFKMECYDISNIQGTNAVGSMVVFVNGVPENSLYRKFKIKTKNTPDDFEMLREVIRRRVKALETRSEDKSFGTLPDLFIIDGGKGQLSSTYAIMQELGVDRPIISLAKRFEDIFVPIDGEGELEFKKKILPLGSQARFLMQRIRDEAHRFAITYHRKLRKEASKFSILDTIPGIGEVLKNKLLLAFGSVEGIKKADYKSLQTIIKNKTTLKELQKNLSMT
jgi:excinuclease ABC subunit C